MKLSSVMILATGLLLGTSPRVSGPADEARLQGTWTLRSLQIAMQDRDVVTLDGDKLATVARLAVKGKQFTLKIGDGSLEMVYKLYPDALPRALDLTVVSGPNTGKVFRAIYELDGDTFTVCRYAEPGKDRPKTFVVKPGSGLMRGVWKRDKP